MSELLDPGRSVLVVIDFQGKLMDLVAHPARLLAAGTRLLKLAEMCRVPVLLTEQYPKGIGPTHPEIRAAFDALTTPKRTMDKTTFDCVADPKFAALLGELRPKTGGPPRQVVVAGAEAHVCVMQTVIQLLRGRDQVHLSGTPSAAGAPSTSSTLSPGWRRPARWSRTTSRSASNGCATRITPDSAR